MTYTPYINQKKLKVSLSESKEYLTRYENWLWQITKYYLEPYADFVADDYSFPPQKNPFPEDKIHPGPYRLGRNTEDINIYRLGHPLAQRIIEQCKRLLSLPATINPISDLIGNGKVENEHTPCPSQEGSIKVSSWEVIQGWVFMLRILSIK